MSFKFVSEVEWDTWLFRGTIAFFVIVLGLLLYAGPSIVTSYRTFTKRGKTPVQITLYSYDGSKIDDWQSKRVNSNTDGNGIEFFDSNGDYHYVSGIFVMEEIDKLERINAD